MWDQLDIFGEFHTEHDTINHKKDNGSYDKFVEKFKPKKTTDDCYTPPLVYDAVADYVVSTYELNKADFVRPFQPGGDYQAYPYKPTDIVVDNPPFSISSQIYKYYLKNNIKFFLFAPALTAFSSGSPGVCIIGVGVPITYENGAKINTSFVTNLESEYIARSDPELYKIVNAANEKVQQRKSRNLPKYTYPYNVLTAAMLNKYSLRGVEFKCPAAQAHFIRAMDCQRLQKKAIFGGGFLISNTVATEREAAEDAAIRADNTSFPLSANELEIIRNLGEKQKHEQ